MNTIVLVRDPSVSDGLREWLESENFTAIRLHGGPHGFNEALRRQPHLLLLDFPLAGVNSRECLLRAARSRTPVIVLGAPGDEEERSRLLDAGADDYLVKPFSARELLARIRAVLRRTSARREPAIRLGDVAVDLESGMVMQNGRQLPISDAERQILSFFLENANRPLTRQQILERIWGYGTSDTRIVDAHVAHLRAKLEPDPSTPRHILTIPAVGYRFVC